MLDIDAIWKKTNNKLFWTSEYQTADIMTTTDNKVIGLAGKVDPTLLNKLNCLPESDAFIFELDADFLISHPQKEIKYQPYSKFQEVNFDLSSFVPLNVTVAEIETNLLEIDPIIKDVRLIDFFERDEWQDKRSLTFNIRLSHFEKTLEKEEIETVRQKAIKVIEKLGGSLRT